VFWVHADNETTFAQDYKAIARKLGLPDKLDDEDLLAAVRDGIEAEPRWLLVLDNADDLALFGVAVRPPPQDTSHRSKVWNSTAVSRSMSLSDYVPRGPAGTVLWTSRDQRIAGTLVGATRGIEIARMTTDEATELLRLARNKSVAEDEAADATVLLRELQWLPLAISQAGAYMRRTATPIHEYLTKLAEGKERWTILNTTESDRHRRPNVPNSILETWAISIERIRQESEIAYNILYVLAYIDNQNIPFEVIEAAGALCINAPKKKVSHSETRELLVEAVTRLREFSFLSLFGTEGSERSYEMHKLVQEALRYGLGIRRVCGYQAGKKRASLLLVIGRLSRKHREAAKPVVETASEVYFSQVALQIVANLFPERTREAWPRSEKYLAHAVRVGEWAEICGKEVEASDLLARVSDYLYDRGRWREREPVDTRVYELRRKALGEKHISTLKSMSELAVTYGSQGRYGEAKALFSETFTRWRDVLGPGHPATLHSMASLATIYSCQGRYDEAEALLAETLTLRRNVLGADHPATLQCMASLATTYHKQGRHGEAEALTTETLQLRRNVLGANHPDTLYTMANLATTYYEQGRYGEAEALSTETLTLQRKVLNANHPETLYSMASLATIYHKQGRYNEAEKIKVETLTLRRDVLGAVHPATLQSMASLATTYHKQGRYGEAEALYTETLALQRNVLGADHPDTLQSMQYLADTYYYGFGQRHEAVALVDECCRQRRRILGPDHPLTKESDGILHRWQAE
jgi:tetratricopeptide (TPR) repeat protein